MNWPLPNTVWNINPVKICAKCYAIVQSAFESNINVVRHWFKFLRSNQTIPHRNDQFPVIDSTGGDHNLAISFGNFLDAENPNSFTFNVETSLKLYIECTNTCKTQQHSWTASFFKFRSSQSLSRAFFENIYAANSTHALYGNLGNE